jgi:hypothetical protein
VKKVVRRSDLIRFRQENERSSSALDKGTVRKIENKTKILGKKMLNFDLFFNEEFNSSSGKSLISSKFP